ncbi:hypothetical protein Slin15195_G097550 [Septoria linicola]|uniref:NYN domain-containing protein n=1 Tax=Septoria linicola TaxID=215465 RepID=A0A9Q9B394_9PEZI|nr:hypothetical protein Slin15195_G097550 [Septoria linicola]
MSTLTETKPWDLSHVLDFVNTLSTHHPAEHNAAADETKPARAANSASHHANGLSNLTTEDEDTNGGVGLGSFDKVWQFLGTPALSNDKKPQLQSHKKQEPTIVNKLDYTSDGAAYTLNRGKPVPIQRHPSFTDGTDGEDRVDGKPLTKTQKKRMRRKERREQEVAQVRLNGGRADAISESEAETTGKKTPAHKASAHVMKEKSTTAHQSPSKPDSNKEDLQARLTALGKEKQSNATKQTAKSPKPAPAHPAKGNASGPDEEKTTSQAVNAVAAAMAALKHASTPATPTPNPAPQRNKNPPSTPTQTKRQPVAQTQPVQRSQIQTSQAVSKLKLVPASVGVQPALNPQLTSLFDGKQQSIGGINPTSVARAMHVSTGPSSAKKPRQQPIIEPKIIRSGEDRHWALLMKLINVFGDDRKHLVSPMNMTTHSSDPKGIHVFVDASNICIGFMDMLKYTRGIHPMAHLPQANLSFDGLALLMERRRPVAKRVLAGSNPWLPAFDKAKAIGYEMNIFEKVYKARELTDRQLFFQQQDARRYGKGSKAPPVHPSASIAKQGSSPPVYSVLGPSIGSGSGSGTETSTAPQYAPAKMIEQGVDEILHLKMMESVVDYETPSTIVLATGDAAQAEYSQGFMAMAERALKKGWTVELVSWSKNISKTYLKSNWTGAWDGRFKIIYLDDFAEELLDM